MSDFLFRGSLADLDPEIYDLTQIEAERQVRKLIMIASESQAPLAVREALGSAFQNIYAEGYPDEETRWMSDEEILDHPARLANYRRNSDPRYYKGVEYADTIEALARRRAAQTFAANGVSADQIYVNVQALSGGPANNAVYQALMNLGDTVLGMNLLFGGHLSHGSRVNRSGKWFNAVHYSINPETEQLDYDQIRSLALEHKPKMIIAGYSSYSWVPDWKKFREIADEVGAYLLADISHIGGLVAAGVVPSPIGIAHVVMSTTHKSLDGPRGAVLMTTDAAIARKLDRAVFPGEQGGPHVNVFAGLALAFKLSQTEQFKKLQAQTIKNAVAMVDQFQKRGLVIPFGGTDTHLINIDCNTIVGSDTLGHRRHRPERRLRFAHPRHRRRGGQPQHHPRRQIGDRPERHPPGHALDHAARLRRSQIPRSWPTSSRMCCWPASPSASRPSARARRAAPSWTSTCSTKPRSRSENWRSKLAWTSNPASTAIPISIIWTIKPRRGVFDLKGQRVRQFLDYSVGTDLTALKPGSSAPTCVHTSGETIEGMLTCVSADEYRLSVPAEKATLAATWLRDLSDGYILFDESVERIMPGPVVVAESECQTRRADGRRLLQQK